MTDPPQDARREKQCHDPEPHVAHAWAPTRLVTWWCHGKAASDEITGEQARRISRSLREEAAHWDRVADSLAAEVPNVKPVAGA